MSGRHAAPGRGRLVSEAIRLGAIVLLLFVILVGGAVLIGNWLGESGDTIPVAESSTTSRVTSTTTTTMAATTTASTAATSSPSVATTAPTSTTTTTEATTTTAPVPRDPAEVVVLVLNSTTRNGLAARVTATLDGLGYETLEPDNYRPRLDNSAIWYAPGFQLEAAELVDVIAGADVAPFPGDDVETDIVIVLGASFSG